MNSRTLVLAAALAIAVSGVATAQGMESSPQQTNSFFRWLFPEAPKPRPAPNKLTGTPVAKPAPTCTILNCMTLVGVAF
jgi:hypothetical protein